MADVQVASSTNPTELLAVGRRHLAVRDFSAAVEALATACELLAKEHGDMADQCAEAYLWYGKSLLGLSREESGVLGDGVPGTENAENAEEDDEDEEDNDEEEQNGEAEAAENRESAVTEEKEKTEETEKVEPESTSKDDEPSSSKPQDNNEAPGTSNGEANDESIANLENEDDVDNLQLAWEMLDLSRSILEKRMGSGGAGGSSSGSGGAGGSSSGSGCAGGSGGEAVAEGARSLLAEVHLALGEVALESETYDKAVTDMQRCLELQKELYSGDDRRIAETHYQIGLANSLASNFEEAITHFKNAANILETRVRSLNTPDSKLTPDVEAEIKELNELLPEIREKIQDMMDYKAETIKRVRETLCATNGASTNGAFASASAPSSASAPRPATNISHLIKRKRQPSETDEAVPAKKPNT